MRIVDSKAFESRHPPLSFLAQAKISDAVAQMANHDYGCVVVVDGEQHVRGIVSERDFLRRMLFEDIDQHDATLGDIMTPDVETANENDDIDEWLKVMSDRHFRHLPVVDNEGHLKGILSHDDLMAYTWPHLLEKSVQKNYEIMLIAGALIVYAIASIIALKWFF